MAFWYGQWHPGTVYAVNEDGDHVTVHWEEEDSVTDIPSDQVRHYPSRENGVLPPDSPAELAAAAPAEQAPVSTNHEHQPFHPCRWDNKPSDDFQTFKETVMVGVRDKLQELEEARSQNSWTFHVEFNPWHQ